MPRLVIAGVVAWAGAGGMNGARLAAQDTRAELTGCYDVTEGEWVTPPRSAVSKPWRST